MRLNKIIRVVGKEFAQYYHFPILEILFIVIMLYFSLNAFSFIRIMSYKYVQSGRFFTLTPSSEMIDNNIVPLFSSLGLCGLGGLPVLLIVVSTALTFAGAFERGEVVTLLSYPIRRTELILIKIFTALAAEILLLVIPVVLIMLSVFPIRGIMIVGLLGWLLSIMEIIALTSLVAVATQRTFLTILITIFALFSIDFASTSLNIKFLRQVINPSEVLMNYFYPNPQKLWMDITGLQDVLLSVGAGFLVLIGCVLLSMWRIKSMDVR